VEMKMQRKQDATFVEISQGKYIPLRLYTRKMALEYEKSVAIQEEIKINEEKPKSI